MGRAYGCECEEDGEDVVYSRTIIPCYASVSIRYTRQKESKGKNVLCIQDDLLWRHFIRVSVV
jgi:hypothetical protein